MEELLVIAFCLTLNALLAGYEMAFVSAPKQQLKKLAEKGSKPAKNILELRQNPERTLSVIQIGITLVGALSAAVGGAGASESIVPFVMSRYGWSEHTAEFISILVVVVPLTYLSVVIGELVPKSMALRQPVTISLLGSAPLMVADRILSPVITVLEWSTKQILNIIGLFWLGSKKRQSSQVESTADLSFEIDSLPEHHQQAVLNLAHIERRKLSDLLVPWNEVVRIQRAEKMETVVPIVFASGHTRIPVLDDSAVVGVLHTKEFLAFRESGGSEWQTIIRPILRVKASDSILATLRLMQRRRSHMAVAWATAGEPLGIVTFEDISEEIWGELYDEDEDSRLRRMFANRIKSRLRPPSF